MEKRLATALGLQRDTKKTIDRPTVHNEIEHFEYETALLVTNQCSIKDI